VNVLDIEIIRFMQTCELSFYFNDVCNKEEFIFGYFKNNARSQLSPKAFGRINHEVNTSNVNSFMKSYRASEEVIRSALKIRYLGKLRISPIVEGRS